MDVISSVGLPSRRFNQSLAQNTVHLHTGGCVNVLLDYKGTVPEKHLKHSFTASVIMALVR